MRISKYLIISQRDLYSFCTGKNRDKVKRDRIVKTFIPRNCSLGNSDIDLVVALDWWRKETNKADFESALMAAGLHKLWDFGTYPHFGYEESWMENDIKVCFT